MNTVKASMIILCLFQVKIFLRLIYDLSNYTNEKIAKAIKNIGILVVSYSIFSELLQNICCWIFVTKIFCLDLTTIKLIGIFVGLIIISLSEYIKFKNQIVEKLDV